MTYKPLRSIVAFEGEVWSVELPMEIETIALCAEELEFYHDELMPSEAFTKACIVMEAFYVAFVKNMNEILLEVPLTCYITDRLEGEEYDDVMEFVMVERLDETPKEEKPKPKKKGRSRLGRK